MFSIIYYSFDIIRKEVIFNVRKTSDNVLVLSTLLGIAKVVVEEKLIEISSKDKDQLDSNDIL